MYDPIGSDTGNEWVEIYNNENASANLTGWKFTEGGTNHNLAFFENNFLLPPNEYAVIVSDNESFLSAHPNFSAMLIKSAFSLSNTGENLVLKNKANEIQDNATYSSLIGGSGNGMSIGKHMLTWNETRPTPGYENIVPDFCDWKVSIISGWAYNDTSNFKIYTELIRGGPVNVTITKWVEDLEGNTIKTYTNSTVKISTHNTLTYSPNFASGAYLIRASIFPSCEDVDLENNFAEKMIFVKEEEKENVSVAEEAKEKESSITIDEIYDLGSDDKAQFGQIIRTKVTAYRGDTGKYSVSVRIEGDQKVSKDFKFNVPEKYTKISLTIPLQIMPNCKGSFKNGNYEIIAEGLGARDEQKIKIFNNTKDACIVVKETVEKIITKTAAKEASGSEESSESASKSAFNYAKPYAVSTIVFESSQKKAEELVPYLAASLMTITAVFMFFSKIPV